MEILQTENLTKYYGEEPLVVKALDGITLQIEQGSFTAIVGTSGSGKSTLLHMLGGLDTPTGGSVVVDGQSLDKMNRSELTIFRRRKIGFIFQNYNLIPNLNIYDNIVLPVELDGRSADREYLDNIISVLGLEGKLDRKPNKLSGGPGADYQAGPDTGGRAYRQPGQPHKSGGCGTFAGDGKAVPSDHCDDYA